MPATRQEVLELIRFRMQKVLPFRLEEAALDFQLLSERRRGGAGVPGGADPASRPLPVRAALQRPGPGPGPGGPGQLQPGEPPRPGRGDRRRGHGGPDARQRRGRVPDRPLLPGRPAELLPLQAALRRGAGAPGATARRHPPGAGLLRRLLPGAPLGRGDDLGGGEGRGGGGGGDPGGGPGGDGMPGADARSLPGGGPPARRRRVGRALAAAGAGRRGRPGEVAHEAHRDQPGHAPVPEQHPVLGRIRVRGPGPGGGERGERLALPGLRKHHAPAPGGPHLEAAEARGPGPGRAAPQREAHQAGLQGAVAAVGVRQRRHPAAHLLLDRALQPPGGGGPPGGDDGRHPSRDPGRGDLRRRRGLGQGPGRAAAIRGEPDPQSRGSPASTPAASAGSSGARTSGSP